MTALRFVGLAMVTAIAPFTILFGSGPAYADNNNEFGQPCSPEGTKLWGRGGPIFCARQADGNLAWVPIRPQDLCVAFCDRP